MMRQHGLLTEALLKMMRHTLGEPPRVDEDQGGAIRADQFRCAIVNSIPHFIAGDGTELVVGNFHCKFHIAAMADIYDASVFTQKPGDLFDRFHRSGKADALRPGTARGRHQCVETREGQRQVRAALIAGDGVNLIHDDGSRGAQHVARLLGGEQNEQRLGRSYQHVRPLFAHTLPLPCGRIAGAERRANRGKLNPLPGRHGGDFGERHFQVDADIVA